MIAQIGAYLIGLPLEALVVDAMRRGPFRQYPLVFLYVIVDFLTTVLEIEPSLAFRRGAPGAQQRWSNIYWTVEWILQALIFLLVISLIYRASGQSRQRRTMLLLVIAATFLVAGTTFFLHYQPHVRIGKWMNAWTRDLNVCAAVLDLGLWALLIGSEKKDYRLLMVSGALGIKFAADAIGQALREMSHSLDTATGLMIMMANLACTFIWWQAFRPPKSGQATLSRNQAAG